MGVGRIRRLQGIRRIVRGEIDLLQEAIGLWDSRDFRRVPLFDQPILMGIEGTLHPAFCLWSVGADDFDTKLLHRARKLAQGCRILPLLLNGGLAIHPINRVLVHVEGDGPAIALEVGLCSAQKRQCVLPLDELRSEIRLVASSIVMSNTHRGVRSSNQAWSEPSSWISSPTQARRGRQARCATCRCRGRQRPVAIMP